MTPIQVLKYRAPTGAFNLGDTIQAVALARLLGPGTEGIYRDIAGQADPERLFVVSGWLGDPSVSARGENSLFAGIHVGACPTEQLRWIRQSRFPVGARDPFTREMLAREGIPSEMVGCVTLTLDRYDGPRAGRYAVDTNENGTIEISQHFPRMTWEEQVVLAEARLETLRTAEIVYASRLHIALPCLAFGTPVVVRPPRIQPERFTLFHALGGVYHKPLILDVRGIAERFRAFLQAGLTRYFNHKDS